MNSQAFSGHTTSGTLGGVLTIFLVRIHSGDILGTAILAAVGAVVSFFISYLLKYIMTRRRR